MTGREQLRNEERIHGIHAGKAIVSADLATLNQQVHVEVDHLVIEPVVTDQRGQIVPCNADVEFVDDDLRKWEGKILANEDGNSRVTFQ